MSDTFKPDLTKRPIEANGGENHHDEPLLDHDFEDDDDDDLSDLDDDDDDESVSQWHDVISNGVHYTFATILFIIGLVGVSNGVEYSGWAIALAILIIFNIGM